MHQSDMTCKNISCTSSNQWSLNWKIAKMLKWNLLNYGFERLFRVISMRFYRANFKWMKTIWIVTRVFAKIPMTRPAVVRSRIDFIPKILGCNFGKNLAAAAQLRVMHFQHESIFLYGVPWESNAAATTICLCVDKETIWLIRKLYLKTS